MEIKRSVADTIIKSCTVSLLQVKTYFSTYKNMGLKQRIGYLLMNRFYC